MPLLCVADSAASLSPKPASCNVRIHVNFCGAKNSFDSIMFADYLQITDETKKDISHRRPKLSLVSTKSLANRGEEYYLKHPDQIPGQCKF